LDGGIRFDTSYRAAADAAWYLVARARGFSAKPLKIFAATFQETGANLGLSETARAERGRLTKSAPFWMRAGRWLWMTVHRGRRWLQGGLQPKDISHEVYLAGRSERSKFNAQEVPGHWPGRWHRL
jgi:hypothetical protein